MSGFYKPYNVTLCSLLMLGREEEQRRTSLNLEVYLYGQRASLSPTLQPIENFQIT